MAHATYSQTFQSTNNQCLSMCKACIYGTELVRLQLRVVKLHRDVVVVEMAGKLTVFFTDSG